MTTNDEAIKLMDTFTREVPALLDEDATVAMDATMRLSEAMEGRAACTAMSVGLATLTGLFIRKAVAAEPDEFIGLEVEQTLATPPRQFEGSAPAAVLRMAIAAANKDNDLAIDLYWAQCQTPEAVAEVLAEQVMLLRAMCPKAAAA